MMRWFGPSWGAPICDPDYHIELPIGRTCFACREPFAPSSQGIQVPLVEGTPEQPRSRLTYWGLDCWLEHLGVNPRRELCSTEFPPRCRQCLRDLPRSERDPVAFSSCPRHPFAGWFYRLQEARGIYPAGWRLCACGEPVLDGHVSCGKSTCDERLHR